MLLTKILTAFLPGVTHIATPIIDKIAFDLDTIGREREIAHLEQQSRLVYQKAGISVNIAMWNMHVPETSKFNEILESGLQPMGHGGGFRIVVFRGGGRIENGGDLGPGNWRCSGNMVQKGNVTIFKPTYSKLWENVQWLQTLLVGDFESGSAES